MSSGVIKQQQQQQTQAQNFNKNNDYKLQVPSEDILARAYKLHAKDPYAARALVFTAVSLYPECFEIQWQAYKWEKQDGHIRQAAQLFGHLINHFPTQDSQEFSNEICAITSAIRADKKNAHKYESYVRLFEQLDSEVQQSILLLTVDYTDSVLSQINLLFLILNRYSYATHYVQAEALMELLAKGIPDNKPLIERLIIEEALPLLQRLKPRLTVGTVSRIMDICLEYHVRRVVNNERKPITNEVWKSVFDLLALFAGIMNWEKFFPFNEKLEYSVYWDKLINIMSRTPAGSTCVLYYASVLYLYTLHCYIKRCNTVPEDDQVNHILVEGFADWTGAQTREQILATPPKITVTTESSEKISRAFVHAAQCWQLLNTDQFQRDFSKLLMTLPLGSWLPRFLFDLSLYFGHRDEANHLINELYVKSSLVQNLQKLSLILFNGGLTPMGMDYVVKIISDLPKRQGRSIRHAVELPRHMIFIPLEQRALVQYCARALIEQLSLKFYTPNCSFKTLGHLLVLLQIEYPRDTHLTEQIFLLLASRHAFYFRNIAHYLTNIGMLEEILHIYNSADRFSMDYGMTFKSFGNMSPGDKEFRAIIKQQMARSHENIVDVVATFILQEQTALMEDLFHFEVEPLEEDDDDVQYINTIPPTNLADMPAPPPLHPLPTQGATTTVIVPEFLPNVNASVAVPVPVITGNLPPPLTAVPVGVITAVPTAMEVDVPALVANVPVISLPTPASPDQIHLIE